MHRQTVAGTREEMTKNVFASAECDFRSHVLKSEGEGRWYCGKPGTIMCSFRVVFAPGHICVFGDMPSGILSMSGRNSLGWLLGRPATSYLLSKLDNPRQCFYQGDATEALEEIHREYPVVGRQLMDDLLPSSVSEWDAQDWYDACVLAGVDDPPDCCWHSETDIWVAAELNKFVDLYEQLSTADQAAG